MKILKEFVYLFAILTSFPLVIALIISLVNSNTLEAIIFAVGLCLVNIKIAQYSIENKLDKIQNSITPPQK